jgi:hypothetical protein
MSPARQKIRPTHPALGKEAEQDLFEKIAGQSIFLNRPLSSQDTTVSVFEIREQDRSLLA